MTYDEYIAKEGVALPIAGFEDLVFDYLEALNKQGAELPLEDIMDSIFTAQELVPHVAEMNSEVLLTDPVQVEGGHSVH